jgi:hypothetical protein
MSLLPDQTFYNPASSFFEETGANGSVIQGPVTVQSSPDQDGAVIISATDAQTASVYGSAQGVAVNPTAALVLGCAPSQQAVTISNTAGVDSMVVGRPAVSGIQLSSAAVLGGAMYITGDNANGANTISLGPNTNAPNCVQIGPGNAYVVAASPYTTQTVTPQLANGTGTILGNSGVVLTNPATPGLYYIGVSCSSLDGPSVASQIFTIAMWNGATWKTGGIGEGVVGTGGVTLSPAPGTAATINFFNNSGGNLVNISFVKFPLFNGLITGFP